jgi:hypothetical protein
MSEPSEAETKGLLVEFSQKVNTESDSDYKPVRPETVVGAVVFGEIEHIEEIAEGCRECDIGPPRL